METNAFHNYDRYMRRNTGRVALSKYVVRDPRSGDVVINGITSDAEWDTLLQRVREQWADHKGSIKDAEKGAEKDIRNLNIAYNSIMGRPIADNSGDVNWLLRQVGNYNFTRLLGQVGFAQIAEYGKPIAALGFKATLQHAPAFRRMVTADGETILRDNLANEVESIFGTGIDRLRDMHDSRYELYGDFFDKPSMGVKGKIEKFMKKANRVTAEGSGLLQSTITQERWVGNSIVQTFSDMAAGSKGLTKERLADLGLSDDMTQRIMGQFNKHVERVPGIGKKVAKINFAQWDDREAATMFRPEERHRGADPVHALPARAGSDAVPHLHGRGLRQGHAQGAPLPRRDRSKDAGLHHGPRQSVVCLADQGSGHWTQRQGPVP
jgi:hypothetical protein